MSTDQNIHLVEIPFGGSGGVIWNRLHSEREDICEAIIKDCQTTSGVDGEADESRNTFTANWHRELLQARLRKIDDALDRLMSGSYGHCSKCGRWIGDTKLKFDPATAFCPGCCFEEEKNSDCAVGLIHGSAPASDSTTNASSLLEVSLKTLHPFDTILVRTLNSEYRILLLDPTTGRALVEGGQCLIEPRESLVTGSTLQGSLFKLGSIAVGYHMEMWVNNNIIRSSRVKSISVERLESAESVEATTAAIQ